MKEMYLSRDEELASRHCSFGVEVMHDTADDLLISVRGSSIEQAIAHVHRFLKHLHVLFLLVGLQFGTRV